MSERTSIVNISGDHEETILQLARHLGRDKIRRRIFKAIYGRGTLPRSKRQIMDAAGIRDQGAKAQQVQNQLDHLSKHHLIVRIENDGFVTDGSRYLYQKDTTVRANKDLILRLADDRKTADQVPTKRRPAMRGGTSIRAATQRTLRKRKHLTVLYLVANPDQASPLRVDAEVRRVQEAIRGSAFRDNITVEYRPAADLDSLINGLNDHRPQIVHFSGHGNDRGVGTDTGKIRKAASGVLSFELLAKALSATDHPPQVVVLNSCESSGAKKWLLPAAKMIISMRAPVTDIAATAFATRFYAAIASGQSVKAAFAQGKVAVEAVSISEADTPELLHTSATNPAKMILT
jgi:CHAT domain-containing protein